MISRLQGRILQKNRLRFGNRILSSVLSLSMAVSLLAGMTFMQKADAAEQVTLHNPVVDMDAMCAEQKVTWDCVWFGSYPQTEVKPGDSEYEALQSAQGWDVNGDIVINDNVINSNEVNGTKYRRMLKGDASYSYVTSGESGYYDWEDDTTYHYFRYEPVKWRVLKTDGSNAMLLSDIVLDAGKYNTKRKDTTWETSTIRSWLNGYNDGMNNAGTDYSSSNFMDSAFTIEEQSAMADTDVVNNDNLSYGAEGGNNTIDKLFLLSESEVYTNTASVYGFAQGKKTYDEARRCKSSDYAKAMGVYSNGAAEGNCKWWLRSPGYHRDDAAYVSNYGDIIDIGYNVYDWNNGVRVALNLNLSSSNLYEYAGTVCSDGIITESEKAEENISNLRIVKVTDAQEGQNVKWDFVYFGRYPQTEVKVTDSEYAALKSAEGWDGNGDIVVNGTKYRRMLKGDATYATSGNRGYYDWEDDTTYHYFRYERVKWRVLKTDGSNAMLLSDIVLDDRKYNTKYWSTTWETSTIRSWLNGYDAGMNQEGIDYGSSNFIDSAFTTEEQLAISDTNVVNNDNLHYGTEGGNEMVDKLFLLSESEIYTKEAKAYGFSKDYFVYDISRRCKSSDYAKAMGVYSETTTYNSNYDWCGWWLRSPGRYRDNAANVHKNGNVHNGGDNVDSNNIGVRVALNLNLSSSNLYTYAGTVCSDGTVSTTGEPTTEKPSAEESTTEEPTTEQPATEEPTTEKPSAEESTTEEPTTEQPSTEEPTTQQSSTEEATTKQPTTEEATTEQPSTEEPTTENPSTEEATTKQPSTEEPTTEQSSTEEPTTENPSTEEAITKQPSTEEPTTEQSSTEEPTTENPSTEEATTKQPATEEATTKQPSTEEPTTKQPSTEEATTEQPSTEESTTEQPSTEKQTTENHTTEEPSNEETTTEQSGTEEPSTQEQATEEPTTNQPPAKKQQTIKVTKSYIKTYGAKAFKLNARLIKGNGKLKYSTSGKTVAAVDKNGKVTIKGTGICTVTVIASATDTYKAASAKITITVKPKKNTVTKVKLAGSRALNVTWKNDAKCTGYELQCSSSNKFTKKNTVAINISKNKTTSYKIRKLAKGKKYYIRIRAYRNVKVNGKTKKLYGDWSSVKQSGKVK